MRSTEQGYRSGWAPRSTGHLAAMPWGIDSLSKGRVIAGAFVGDITATTGSIGTAELADAAVTSAKIASLAVGTTDIAAAAVTDAKRSFGWSTLSNTTASVIAATLGAVGGYLLTNVGSSLGVVITSSGLSDPTAGDSYRFNVDAVAGTTVGIYLQSTGATFDGTKKNLKLGENDQFAVIEAVSASRWAVTSWSTGVSLETTT